MNKNPLVAIAALMVGGALLLSKDEKEKEEPVKLPNSIDYDDPNLQDAMMNASNPIDSEDDEEEFFDESDDEEEEEEDEDFDEDEEDEDFEEEEDE